ncbi:MAG: MFS transporter [Pseudobutyrivibrio sp.]|nr:MFS transporter [Pseudobutyrivibrio sp.]
MEFLNNKNNKTTFINCYSVFLLNGMLALSIGSLLPFIRDARGLEYAFCGLIVSLHSIGNLFSSFFAGTLPVFIGKKKSILLFNSFYAISYILILFSASNMALAFAFFLTGLARGATSNFCNTAINSLAPGRAWILNGLHAMFSIGALAFPIFLTILTKNNPSNWTYACFFMLAMGVLSLILYFMIPTTDDVTNDKTSSMSSMDFIKAPLFHLCTLTLFFYLCAEQGVIGWLVTYLKDTGILSASKSQLSASIQWTAILIGRLLTAYLSTRFDRKKLIRIMSFGLVLFFLVLITGRSELQVMIGIFGFGLAMAGIYPTTVSFSGYLIKDYPLAWSFVLTLASFGSIIMPSVIGRIADTFSIYSGMCSVAVAVIIDFIFIWLLTHYIKKSESSLS